MHEDENIRWVNDKVIKDSRLNDEIHLRVKCRDLEFKIEAKAYLKSHV